MEKINENYCCCLQIIIEFISFQVFSIHTVKICTTNKNVSCLIEDLLIVIRAVKGLHSNITIFTASCIASTIRMNS